MPLRRRVATTQITWGDRVERMISWMEEHPKDLKERQVYWHRKVKEQVFNTPADQDIT